jgi:hypothetical protein
MSGLVGRDVSVACDLNQLSTMVGFEWLGGAHLYVTKAPDETWDEAADEVLDCMRKARRAGRPRARELVLPRDQASRLVDASDGVSKWPSPRRNDPSRALRESWERLGYPPPTDWHSASISHCAASSLRRDPA